MTSSSGTGGSLTQLNQLADAAGPHLDQMEQEALDQDRAVSAASPLEELRRVSALQELLSITEERAVARAAADGRTQREIAAALRKPQTQVHRILRQARLGEASRRASAREVILQFRAGVISEGMMIGLLRGASEGKSGGGQHDEGFVRDDWDEIRTAFLSGLLTEDQYESLRTTKMSASGRRRR